jgi:hypothetical protein
LPSKEGIFDSQNELFVSTGDWIDRYITRYIADRRTFKKDYDLIQKRKEYVAGEINPISLLADMRGK